MRSQNRCECVGGRGGEGWDSEEILRAEFILFFYYFLFFEGKGKQTYAAPSDSALANAGHA